MIRAQFQTELFSEDKGLLEVEYHLFPEIDDLPFERFSRYPDISVSNIRTCVEFNVMKILCDVAEAMYKQREWNFHYGGHHNESQLLSLQALPFEIMQARRFKEVRLFIEFFDSRILIRLKNIQPSMDSRFNLNYSRKLAYLVLYVERLKENPDVFHSEKGKKNPDFSVFV